MRILGSCSLGSLHYLPSHSTQTNEQCSKSDYVLSSHCTGMAVIKSQEEWREKADWGGGVHAIPLSRTYMSYLHGSRDYVPSS